MRHIPILWLICVLLVSISSANAQIAPLTAEFVSTPANLTGLSVGQSFQVEIQLAGTGNGYGYSALLTYDPTVLEVKPISLEGRTEPGAAQPSTLFPIPAGGQNTFFARNHAENGQIDVAFTYLNPALPTENLTGTLLAITFTLLSSEPTNITLDDLRVIVFSDEGQTLDIPIQFTTETSITLNGGIVTSSENCNFNAICDNALGETSLTCPADCPATASLPATVSIPEEDSLLLPILIGALIVVGLAFIVVVALLLRRRPQSKRKSAR